MAYPINDKDVVTNIPVLPRTDIAATHTGVHFVINIVVNNVVQDCPNLGNIENPSIILVTFFLPEA